MPRLAPALALAALLAAPPPARPQGSPPARVPGVTATIAVDDSGDLVLSFRARFPVPLPIPFPPTPIPLPKPPVPVPSPSPAPGPIPTPTPDPEPAPSPPVPPDPGPAPVAGTLHASYVVAPDASPADAAVRTHPNLRTALASLDATWRTYRSDEADVASLNFGPTISATGLPCLIVQDRAGKVVAAVKGPTARQVIEAILRLRGQP